MKTSLGYNGISQVTMNYCLSLQNTNHYDFIVVESAEDIREDFSEICHSKEWRIFHLPSPIENISTYIKSLRRLLVNGEYDIYHINGNSALMFVDVFVCINLKIKIVTHSHNTNCKYKKLHYLLLPFLAISKISRVACSSPAGNWIYLRRPFVILNNCIDYNRFRFSFDSRDRLRKALKINEDEIVLIQVGAFLSEKNQLFTIQVFELLQKVFLNTKLLLCGEGVMEKEIQKQIRQIGLSDRILCVGKVNNIEEYYSVSDILLQPSVFEGLPLTVIEGQVSGLPCLLSSSITNECKISDSIVFLDIYKPSAPSIWREEILKILRTYNIKMRNANEIAHDFDINVQSSKLQELYENA